MTERMYQRLHIVIGVAIILFGIAASKYHGWYDGRIFGWRYYIDGMYIFLLIGLAFAFGVEFLLLRKGKYVNRLLLIFSGAAAFHLVTVLFSYDFKGFVFENNTYFARDYAGFTPLRFFTLAVYPAVLFLASLGLWFIRKQQPHIQDASPVQTKAKQPPAQSPQRSFFKKLFDRQPYIIAFPTFFALFVFTFFEWFFVLWVFQPSFENNDSDFILLIAFAAILTFIVAHIIYFSTRRKIFWPIIIAIVLNAIVAIWSIHDYIWPSPIYIY